MKTKMEECQHFACLPKITHLLEPREPEDTSPVHFCLTLRHDPLNDS